LLFPLLEFPFLIQAYPNLIVDHWVLPINLKSLLEAHKRSLQVIRSKVLHPDEQVGQVATWEQPRCSSICGHRLIRFILSCETVSKSNPTGCEVLVDAVGLVVVLAGQVVLPYQEVVGANSEPGDGEVGVGADQLVGQVVELSHLVELDHDGAVHGDDPVEVEVFIDYSFDHLECLVVVLLIVELLSFDLLEVKGITSP